MTTHLRIIHWDKLGHAAEAKDAANPLRDMPEIIRVWTPSPGVLEIVQVKNGTMTLEEAVRQIEYHGCVWHQDLLKTDGSDDFTLEGIENARRGIIGFFQMLKTMGVGVSRISLLSDWELWSITNPLWDYGNWFAAVQDWPGPTGNFGNARSHVPAPFLWPATSASVWASHGTGTTPAMFRDGIKAAKPRFRKAKGLTVACITDPDFWDGWDVVSGATRHREYVNASARADIVLHWCEGRPGEMAKTGYRLTQDRIIARAIGVVA